MNNAQQIHLSPTFMIHERMKLLTRSVEQLLRSEDPRAFLESLFGQIARELGLEIYFHYRMEESGRALRLAAFGGVPDDVAVSIARLNLGQGVCGAVAEERNSILVEDVQRSTDTRIALIQGMGITAYACHPLIAWDQLVGTLSFGTRLRPAFDAETLATLQMLSEQVAMAIERKQAEDALREREERFRMLTEAAPQLVWIAQPDGAVEYYNRQWTKSTGLTLQQSQGSGWQRAIHPDDLGRTGAAWQRAVETGELYEIEHRLLGADGEPRWHLTRSLPLRGADGRLVKWLGTTTDIHAQKLAESEREALLASERAARACAEHASNLKDEFLAMLSHELRTPLNVILGWTQILRRGQRRPEDIEKGLEIIERNTRLQVKLISDLLDVSRIVSGKIRLTVTAIDLASAVAAAIDALRPTANAKGVLLEESLETVMSRGDSARIQQVMWNLLSNAIKFTPRGGRVCVTLAQAGERVEIRICDTGQGIPLDVLPHIFERFRQADASAARRHGGLGNGLAIVKHIVELHGGRVSVTSEGEGLGATFIVELPLEEARASVAAVDGWSEDAGEATLRGLHVLVVDDEPDARDYVQRVLEEREVEVRSVSSASEALAIVAALRPDILVSDIGMPDEDGYGLIRQIRGHEDDAIRSLPAVALTAFVRAEDRARALAAGYQLHVSKPVEPAELLAALASLAGAARARRQQAV